MQKLYIKHLGPIEECEINIDEFMVCTGPQASGKSTIAKSIFFFKNIKNILFVEYKKKYLLNRHVAESRNVTVKQRFMKEVRANFLQIFGITGSLDGDMFLQYQYTEKKILKVFLEKNKEGLYEVKVDFSKDFNELFEMLENRSKEIHNHPDPILELTEREIKEFFNDKTDVVYIPAGRSMITLLSNQMNYIYSSMDDIQKRNMDYCTRSYLEKILQMKSVFTISPVEMLNDVISMTYIKIDEERAKESISLMKQLLQGEYINKDGEERLQVSKNRYVKLNYASSGQQEVVWILNVLFYYLLNGESTYFIIEEPESHLFPNSQKLVMEFIALVCNGNGNQLFLTTHSPYILGTINNLLYADKVSKDVDESQLSRIISKNKWLNYDKVNAIFVQNGKIKSCLDEEFKSIENEVIDGVSEQINEDYDKILELKG